MLVRVVSRTFVAGFVMEDGKPIRLSHTGTKS